jgi:hypothetical protein
MWRGITRSPRWLDGTVGAAILVLAVCTVMVWHFSGTDVMLFGQYAAAFWQGHPPFTAFPSEYPPLAVVPFALTLAPNGPIVFAAGMGFVVLGLYAVLAFWEKERRRAVFAAMLYLFISAPVLLLARYDILPTFMAMLAIWATERRRFGWAQFCLGLGALIKIFPIFFVPLVLLVEVQTRYDPSRPWRAQWRTVGLSMLRSLSILIATLGIVCGFVLWRNPAALLSPFVFNAQRPVQVESLLATIAWLGSLAGVPLHFSFTFHSHNWSSPLTDILLPWSIPMLLGGCMLIYFLLARGKLTLRAACVALLGIVLLTNKVFSTQYIIWLLPFVALEEGLAPAWLLLCVLHIGELALYPFGFTTYTPTQVALFAMMAGLRNATLAVLTVRMVLRRRPTLAVAPMHQVPEPVLVEVVASGDAAWPDEL